MRVLVACEFSRIVASAFERQGHYALSCDLLPAESQGNHYQGDVFDILNNGWDLMIAHPPCTYLCNSGVRWLKTQSDRQSKMIDGSRFFKALLDANIPRICIENPIPHKYALQIIGRKYDQIIQPYNFGHAESKAICLWLKHLPPLINTLTIKENIKQSIHLMPPSANRSHLRSIFYSGIAEAMAKQWDRV